MSTQMEERFIELFKESGLSQENFGIPMGMSRSEVKNILYGITTVKEPKIPLICKAYNVREEWFRTGALPKHAPEPLGDALGALTASAAHNTIEDADAYFARIRAELGDAKFLMLYEIFRSVLPQYDKEPEEKN